uniref:Uncharacterized protein n=1 Tax=Glossina palpalis gambiensis TaxID=67801 RepID=A0A1B0AL46_9MUSC
MVVYCGLQASGGRISPAACLVWIACGRFVRALQLSPKGPKLNPSSSGSAASGMEDLPSVWASLTRFSDPVRQGFCDEAGCRACVHCCGDPSTSDGDGRADPALFEAQVRAIGRNICLSLARP